MQEHPIILKPLMLDPLMRTRLYMELSPGLKCFGRSPEAVLDARRDMLEYGASKPVDAAPEDEGLMWPLALQWPR